MIGASQIERVSLMTKGKTELVFILDKSGSMHGLEADTIGGFNSLIEKQKEDGGDTRLTLVTFNHDMDLVHDAILLTRFLGLSAGDYVTGGSTALYDAVGKTLSSVSRRIRDANPEDRADRVLVVITTDGMENASRTYRHEDIRELIGRLRGAYEWEFMFLGANIDSVKTAQDFGISHRRTSDYHADSRGIRAEYQSLERAVSQFRMCNTIDDDWDEIVKKDFKERT
jgi:uncharacterized protein YegL